ncbi:MAG: hypothetical protein IJH09_02335 [Clostridia bacterium]|nr:hypothetical protein [Clostridia bacterium]
MHPYQRNGIVSYFSSNLALLADGILVGRYVGVNGLAAIGLCTPVILTINLIGAFLACGAETLCSRALGMNDGEQAQRIYGAQLSLSLVFSVLFMAVGLFLMPPIARALSGNDATLIPFVTDYSQVYLLAAIANIMTFPPFWFLPLDGKNTSVTAMMLIMGIGNILLDIWFLWGLGMGVRGAALASVLSAGASALFGMIRLHSGRHCFSLRLALPKGSEWRDLAVAGSPEANNNLLQVLRVLTINAIFLQTGGNAMVAQYAVVSSMTAISEAVTMGVPQSGTAILGVYCGEKDNPSALILLRQQLRVGLIGCAVMALLLGLGTPVIGWAYQVTGLSVPMWMLSLSLFPVLVLNILVGYYRVAGREMLANILIALRVYCFCVLSLLALMAAGASLWPFQVVEALLTLLAWVGLTKAIHRREKEKNVSRWLLMDMSLEDGGNSINFSSPADTQSICDASERIGTFCAANQMAPKQTMRVSLALEEMMTLITQFNSEQSLSFDIRVFAVHGVIGIRIRYGGIDFNPLDSKYEDDERFMGIQMVRRLVETTVYQSTFAVNSLLILIE